MAFVIADRVKETSTSTGTGDFALAGAMTGYIRFSGISGIAVGDTSFYCIQGVDGAGAPTGEWEVGLGTYSAANTLTRTTVLASSNAGAAVSFSAGTKQVFLTVPATQAAWPRERLTAARTYYVRTDGSDSNTGLANTAGGAFLTIQKAVDVVCHTLDTQSSDVTIQLADGTYTAGALYRSRVGHGTVFIQGNAATPSNVLVSVTSANCFSMDVPVSGSFIVRDLKLQTTTAGSALLATGAGAVISYSNVVFGACVTAHTYADNYGRIQCVGNYSITAGAQMHHQASGCGVINCTGRTVTITGTPAFSVAFAWLDSLGAATLYSNTYTGAATGTRYTVTRNSSIHVNGAATTYLPGNAAGTTATGGQYS